LLQNDILSTSLAHRY